MRIVIAGRPAWPASTRAASVVGGLGLCLLLAAPAEGAWYQVPKRPLWVELPAGWRGRADARNPLLLAEDTKGLRLEVLGEKAKGPLADAILAFRKRYGREFSGMVWTAEGSVHVGRFRTGREQRTIRVTGVERDGYFLLSAALASVARADAVRAVQDGVHRTARRQNARPTVGWHTVPGAGVEVRLPELAWHRVGHSKTTLRLARSDGSVQVEIRRVTSTRTPAALVERWAGALSRGPKVVWRWTGSVWRKSGARRVGEATLERDGKQVTLRLGVLAVPAGDARILVLIQGEGSAAGAAFDEALSIADSLRPVK